ncbi:MAG TPA: lipopolysaccharide biosynthesis protein, partial [Candidatus Angelobacter sp.]
MAVVNTQELVTSEAPATPHQQSLRFASALNYGVTFATEFLVMISQIILYKIVASWLGQTGFSEYAVARRVVAFLQPVTMVGFGVALPRYLALAEGRGDSQRCSRYLFATVLAAGGFTLTLAAALMIGRHWFSYLLFGAKERQYLIPAVALMLVGMSLHAILYAFFRGRMAMGRANALQVMNNCLAPLVVFALFHKDPADYLVHLGLAWTVATAVILLLTAMQHGWQRPRNEARELLGYGLQRVPGDFAFMALLGLPAIFAAHLTDIREAGMVAFGLAIVNMVASAFAPIGIILLPKVSRALGSGDFNSVRHEVVLIRRIALVIPAAIVLIIELFGSRLIRIYLGPAYTDTGFIVNLLVLGAVPLAFYSALRSVIDAFHHRAINTLNVLVALVLFLLGSAIGGWLPNFQILLWSFAGAMVVLAL